MQNYLCDCKFQFIMIIERWKVISHSLLIYEIINNKRSVQKEFSLQCCVFMLLGLTRTYSHLVTRTLRSFYFHNWLIFRSIQFIKEVVQCTVSPCENKGPRECGHSYPIALFEWCTVFECHLTIAVFPECCLFTLTVARHRCFFHSQPYV